MSIKIDHSENAHGTSADKKIPVRIDYAACDSSGACVLVCPEDVFERRKGQTSVVKGEACTECWICVDNCSSSAIHIG